MASHRRPKQPNRARVTVFTATAAAAVALSTQSAQAAPDKDDVKRQVDNLYEDAERATEKYNGAKERQDKLEEDVKELQDKAARGQQELNDLRDGLGSLATAQYRSGSIDPSVQLFLSADPDTYLDKASTMDRVSGKQAESLERIADKQRSLAQQRQEASEKLKDLEETRKELGSQKKKVQDKLSDARALLNELTEEEQAALAEEEQRASREAEDRVDLGDVAPGSSHGAAALSAAQSKLGAPYVYGATGPSSFDCSGLTGWAFSQAGVALPRISQDQANVGTRISSVSQLQPGDLVFFYSDLHHVGIYAGNGQIIHAPKPGAVVRYEAVGNMPFMWGARV
ncbi:NlpC/P60 family protein [Streptomyces sp. NBC_01808]|uniref:C40 family peptidase n=1 Tax=Streptomyces sp. NBC_01808 TaxID=2975947 RepID=UPI002DDB21BD|nr:NlpC/P60 family protein [Streptomyces sp. NBC_01808]WSA37337.1 NlpC/P60 family protein [Streptomyces sp. NBC_01808]